MIRRCLAGVLICYGITGSMQGQSHDLLFHQLRVQDGLSQATNSFVYKDTRGFVWISSLSGLNRFDGTEVDIFYPDRNDSCSITGENIQSQFFEDASSRIWFTTYESIQCYDWKTDCFSKYILKTESGNDRIGYHIFYLDAAQKLWMIVGGEDIYTLDAGDGSFQFITQLKKAGIRGLAMTDRSGMVSRILTYYPEQAGVEIVEVNSPELNTSSFLKWNDGPHSAFLIRKILCDGDSVCWILTRNQLTRYDWRSGTEINHPVENAETFAALDDSTLLISIRDKGMKGFHKNSFQVDPYWISIGEYTAPDLLSDVVNSISIDRDKGLWASSTGLGISYAMPGKKKFNTYLPEIRGANRKEFIPQQFIPFSRDSVWCFTTDNGVYAMTRKGDAWQSTSLPEITSQLLARNFILTMYDHAGCYWLSTWGGLSVFDPQRNQNHQVSDERLIVFSLVELQDGRILMTTNQKGLHQVMGNVKDGFVVERVALIPDTLDYMPVWQDPQGRIWLNENLQQFIIVDPKTFLPMDSLEVNGICNRFSVSSDQSTIWISSSTGLFEIDAESLTVIGEYDERSGLPAAGFSSMVMDPKGILWLTHQKGVISFDPRTKTHQEYAVEDGLSQFEYTNASCIMEDGEIWFGAIQGISRFYPDRIHLLQIRALPHITSLLINDKTPDSPLKCERTGATNVTEIQKLTFSFRQNTLSFKVNSLEYSSPRMNKVRYRMEGIDDHEIETFSGNLVRYPNMPHGTYRFIVYAANSDGIYNEVPKVFTIVITPPFYKTWWFISLMALLVVSIIAYVIYLRFSKALELQKVRLKLYENLHDDVGSRLTAIVLSAEDLERNENLSHPKLKTISMIARSIVGNMRRLVWAIDPENDKMNSILQKINHDSALILDDKIDFFTEIEPRLKNIVVPGEIRYQMSSICNEALNNISKYAQATKVQVKITKEGRFLKLVVEDNGIGFNPKEKVKDSLTGSGYGMSNMHRRASRIGGTFHIHSQPGEGTRVEFLFPFHG